MGYPSPGLPGRGTGRVQACLGMRAQERSSSLSRRVPPPSCNPSFYCRMKLLLCGYECAPFYRLCTARHYGGGIYRVHLRWSARQTERGDNSARRQASLTYSTLRQTDDYPAFSAGHRWRRKGHDVRRSWPRAYFSRWVGDIPPHHATSVCGYPVRLAGVARLAFRAPPSRRDPQFTVLGQSPGAGPDCVAHGAVGDGGRSGNGTAPSMRVPSGYC